MRFLRSRPLTPGARREGAGVEMLLDGEAVEDFVALRDQRQALRARSDVYSGPGLGCACVRPRRH